MIAVDSSGWIEIVRGGERREAFREAIKAAGTVFVPALVVYEVYRIVARLAGETEADGIAAHLRSHTIVDLTDEIAIAAAKLGKQHHLATADAVIYATAHHLDVALLTGDAHFARLPRVEYIPLDPEAQPPR